MLGHMQASAPTARRFTATSILSLLLQPHHCRCLHRLVADANFHMWMALLLHLACQSCACLDLSWCPQADKLICLTVPSMLPFQLPSWLSVRDTRSLLNTLAAEQASLPPVQAEGGPHRATAGEVRLWQECRLPQPLIAACAACGQGVKRTHLVSALLSAVRRAGAGPGPACAGGAAASCTTTEIHNAAWAGNCTSYHESYLAVQWCAGGCFNGWSPVAGDVH